MDVENRKSRRGAAVRRLILWMSLTPIAVYAFLFVSGELWGSGLGRVVLLALIAIGAVAALVWFSRPGTSRSGR